MLSTCLSTNHTFIFPRQNLWFEIFHTTSLFTSGRLKSKLLWLLEDLSFKCSVWDFAKRTDIFNFQQLISRILWQMTATSCCEEVLVHVCWSTDADFVCVNMLPWMWYQSSCFLPSDLVKIHDIYNRLLLQLPCCCDYCILVTHT